MEPAELEKKTSIKLQLLLLFMLFSSIVGISGLILLRDEPPIDDSFLRLGPLPSVAPSESVYQGFVELAAQLPEPPNWSQQLSDWHAAQANAGQRSSSRRRRARDRSRNQFLRSDWIESGTFDQVTTYLDLHRSTLDQLQEISQRKAMGLPLLTEAGPGTPDTKVTQLWFARVQSSRIKGRGLEASRDLEALHTMVELHLESSRNLLDFHVALSRLQMVWSLLDRLVAEGQLDAASETRWLERYSVLAGRSTQFRRAVAGEYQSVVGNENGTLSLAEWKEEIGIVGKFVKENRTRRRLFDYYRESVIEQQTPPFQRTTTAKPTPAFLEKIRDKLDMGSVWLSIVQLQLKRSVLDVDFSQLSERGARLCLLLRKFERITGRLPENLKEILDPLGLRVDAITDPYSGEPFRFDRTRRLIWSLGVNLSDEGAREFDPSDLVKNGGSGIRRPQLQQEDIFWYLHPPE